MRHYLTTACLAAGSLAFAADHHAAQGAVEQRLMSQYKLTDSNPSRATSGTLVTISKAGFQASPYGQIPVATSTWDHGRIRSGFKDTMVNNMVKVKVPLEVGTRLYVTKIEAKDTFVGFDVILADAFEGVYYRASIHFELGKSYLESPDFDAINRTIGDVLQIDQGGGGGQQQQQQQQQQQPARPMRPTPPPPTASAPPPAQYPDAPPPPPPPATVAAAAAPVQIQPGWTVAQVQSSLGKPDKVTKFGAKEVQVFGKLKVTFLNGKVTDVE